MVFKHYTRVFLTKLGNFFSGKFKFVFPIIIETQDLMR